MKLNQIADNAGARKNRMRIGRGIGPIGVAGGFCSICIGRPVSHGKHHI